MRLQLQNGLRRLRNLWLKMNRELSEMNRSTLFEKTFASDEKNMGNLIQL